CAARAGRRRALRLCEGRHRRPGRRQRRNPRRVPDPTDPDPRAGRGAPAADHARHRSSPGRERGKPEPLSQQRHPPALPVGALGGAAGDHAPGEPARRSARIVASWASGVGSQPRKTGRQFRDRPGSV
ncbi:MAG: Amidase, partial [uncultured Microvirga sp.]